MKNRLLLMSLILFTIGGGIGLFTILSSTTQAMDIVVSICVPDGVCGKAELGIIEPVSGFVTNQPDITMKINYKNVGKIEVYVDDSLVNEYTVDNIDELQYKDILLHLTKTGEYQIKVVAYDVDDNAVTQTITIIYDPGYSAPNTGFIQIGNLTIKRTDLTISTILLLILITGTVFIVYRQKQEKRGKENS